jgi:phospholipid transport system substrate-binding protein
MQRPIIKALSCMLMLGMALATVIVAQPTMSAEQLVRKVTKELIAALEEHQGQWDKHQVKLESVIERIVMPHVDFGYMAKKIVGRSHWQKADAQTQANFQRVFKTAVIRTYSHIFSHYDGEIITIYSLRQVSASKDRARVGMSIARRTGGAPVQVKYYCSRKGATWLIYDFHVEDVSVLANYRAQYANTLQHGGIEALTLQIDRNNKQHKNISQ